MRKNHYDPSLLRELDALDLPAAPLEAGEADRVLALAGGRVHAANGPAKRAPRRVWRWVRGGAAAAAACVPVLGSVNFVDPAFAESLPVVGNLFAWINRDADARLRSEQLNQYAGTVEHFYWQRTIS